MKKHLLTFLALFLISASTIFAQVTVTIADLNAPVGQVVTVPIVLSGVEGYPVENYQLFPVMSHPDIKFLGADYSNTLSSGVFTQGCFVVFVDPEVQSPDSQQSIDRCSGFGSGFSTSGTLIKLKFRLDSEVSGTVTLNNFLLNGPGSPSISPLTPVINVGFSAAPTALADSYSVDEGTTLVKNAAEGVLANDISGTTLTATLVTTTSNGTLSFAADGSFTYTHDGSETTSDAFTYTATNSEGTTAPAAVTITVNPINDDPIADAKSATTLENSSVNITLSGSDAEDSALTFALAVGPSNGGVVISGSTATYTPTNGFTGSDSFTYTANDGTSTSVAATVSITVQSLNAAPVAVNVSGATLEDQALGITLSATDADGDALTFSVTANPTNGSVSLNGTVATYTPGADYFGTDSFDFVANDGTVNSNTATVSITVNAVNDAPTASDLTLSVIEDTPESITLIGADVEGDPLTFSVSSQPANGSVSVQGAIATYTPSSNHTGADSFSYTANDGALNSAPASVTVTVSEVNDPPVAEDGSASGAEDSPISIPLSAVDPDGDTLTFALDQDATQGSVTITGSTAVYTPDTNFNGSDSFTFKASDGQLESSAATITLTVTPVNDAPTADDLATSTTNDASVDILLTGFDPDGDPLTFTVNADPAFGAVVVSGNTATYLADPGFVGTDSFGFVASDGTLSSSTAIVSITVLPALTFSVQFINAGGGGLPAAVDVYYGGVLVSGGIAARTGSGFLTLPATTQNVEIAVSPSSSSSDMFASYAPSWGQGEVVTAVFAGVGGVLGNTRMIETMSALAASSGIFAETQIVHASAATGAVDVETISSDPSHVSLVGLASGMTFESISTVQALSPDVHLLRVKNSGIGGATLDEFQLDFSADAGAFMTTIFAGQAGGIGDDALAMFAVAADGSTRLSLTVTGTGSPSELPSEFILRGNYPNPFNPTTTIQFDLPERADVQIDVLDLLGKTLITIPSQSFGPGEMVSVRIDAGALSSGIYMYRVVARTASQTYLSTGTMTLIK